MPGGNQTGFEYSLCRPMTSGGGVYESEGDQAADMFQLSVTANPSYPFFLSPTRIEITVDS